MTQPLQPHEHVVIIGTGQAGVQMVDSLRQNGFTGPITVVGDEPHTPYQRPPLSKELAGSSSIVPLPLRPEGFFDQAETQALLGVEVTDLDPQAKELKLSDGGRLSYNRLVLATGARNRDLPIEGADLQGVHGLRTLDDAENLHTALSEAWRVVIVGAGFIGLEVAACANKLGKEVTVLEFADRPMARALTSSASHYVAAAHTETGINLKLGEGIASLQGQHGKVTTAVGSSGEQYPADLVLIGVGVVPNTELAENAGLKISNGIAVDTQLCTSDPHIYAVGDCTTFPNHFTGGPTRLESVQNATDQARYLGALLVQGNDDDAGYRELPWFWSNQGGVRIQIAGISAPGDEAVLRGDPETGKFSVLCFRDGALAAVESINAPKDHMAARKLLVGDTSSLSREELSDPETDLRKLAKSIR
ncbi:oxidoreductase [Nesterenkonia sp. MY13]|uniref:Oxidoreductase n=1 Tax=Nesterenkonia sedimenti TaxID=1463632 RepID=A0A7X8YDA8_9MICC|nr:FAD-dependent oxidoreductase [Nesterenkonia sedimenti]NLS09250.1 oxidoreductase [Nesterenkonia sedimenti]